MGSIFGWDLPPGCRVSDIPGNTPEDEKWEAIYDKFWDKDYLTKEHIGTRITEDEYSNMDKLWKSNAKTKMELVDLIDKYVTAAIEFGMEIGAKDALDNYKSDEAEYKYYLQETRVPKLRAYFKKQREIKKELIQALQSLITKYWMNQGSDGKACPHPKEFIACITPKGIPDYWRNAQKALDNAK